MLIKQLISKYDINDYYLAKYDSFYFDATSVILKQKDGYFDVRNNVHLQEDDIILKKNLTSYIDTDKTKISMIQARIYAKTHYEDFTKIDVNDFYKQQNDKLLEILYGITRN